MLNNDTSTVIYYKRRNVKLHFLEIIIAMNTCAHAENI